MLLQISVYMSYIQTKNHNSSWNYNYYVNVIWDNPYPKDSISLFQKLISRLCSFYEVNTPEMQIQLPNCQNQKTSILKFSNWEGPTLKETTKLSQKENNNIKIKKQYLADIQMFFSTLHIRDEKNIYVNGICNRYLFYFRNYFPAS